MNIATTFATFRQTTTDDVSAAILTLASIIAQPAEAGASLTVKEAAEKLGVSPDTIYDLVESKKLPCRRIGRAIRIESSDLEAVGKPQVFKIRNFS